VIQYFHQDIHLAKIDFFTGAVFLSFDGRGKSNESKESNESRLFSGSGSGGFGIVRRMRFLKVDPGRFSNLYGIGMDLI